MTRISTGWLLVAFLLINGVSYTNCLAGGFSTQRGELNFTVDQILAFSKRLEREIGKRGARVAIVARVGVPPNELPEGIHFTHVGFAVYSRIKTAGGEEVLGYAMYNLYQDESDMARSVLVQDYPPDFFAAVSELKAGVIIPKPNVQRRLLALIHDQQTRTNFHNPRYSVISNPSNGMFQNCTEYVLQILVSAIYQTKDLKKIQANIARYFSAQQVNASKIKLLLGSIFSSDVFLDDHHGNQPKTATFGSLVRFMEQYNLVEEVFSVHSK